MAKRLAYWMQATHMNLGVVQINKIQALVWQIWDSQKHSTSLYASISTPDIIFYVIESKIINREQENTNIAVKNISNFDPNNYDTQKYTLFNMMF